MHAPRTPPRRSPLDRARAAIVALLGAAGLGGALASATSPLIAGGCLPDSACSANGVTTRCAGLDLQHCVPNGEGQWTDVGLCGADCTSDTCPAGPVSLCVTNPAGTAFCAISPTPVAACATGASTACWLNDVVTCDPSGFVASVVTPCGSLTCADSAFDGGAFCAASAAPIPPCSGGALTVCWQNQIVDCDPTGYARSIVQGCGDLTCVDTPGCGPLCVVGDAPNPLCTPTTASVCDDGTPTDCQCGYGVATHPNCGAPDLCQTAPVSGEEDADAGADQARTGAFCSSGPTPFAGCPPTGTSTICVGSTLVQCTAGWETAETSCTGECHAYAGAGFCG